MKRSLLASFVGGIWACLIALARLQKYHFVELLTMYPVAYEMIRIAFPKKNKKQKNTLVFHFFIIAWMGGGILNFLYDELWDHKQSVLGRMILMLLVWLIALVAIQRYQKKELQKQEESMIYTVELSVHGKKLKMQALWDSGNRLQNASGKPVCIVEQCVMERLMGEQWESLHNWTMADGTFLLERGFQLISYHSIGMEEGVLPAICGEQIVIQTEEGDITIKHPVIGYCDSHFSVESFTEHTYEMILPSAYGVYIKK